MSTRPRRRFRWAAGLLVIGMVAAACSEDDGDDGTAAPATPVATAPADASGLADTAAPADTTATADTTAPGNSTAPPETAGGDRGDGEMSLEEATAVAQEYVGGTPGEATGEPLVVGYVNQEGGTPGFPEATVGTEAAVKLVNEVLGGAGGRPIELKSCVANTAEDGTRCAQEMLADDAVSVVVTGVLAFDSITGPLLSTLDGQKPVIIGNPVTPPEFFATDAYAFQSGSPGVIQGLAIFAAKYLPEGVPSKVAVVYVDNSVGQASFNSLTVPVLNQLGVTEVTGVPIPDTAGPQDFAPAIQAAGGADADVLIPLVTVQGCIGTAQALQDLGIDIPVVTTMLCLGTPMTEYREQQGESGIAPNNWYFGGYGYNYYISGEPTLDAYLALIQDYATAEGIEDIEYTGFAGPTFGNVLTLTQFINEIGTEAVTPESIREAVLAFDGPQWGVVGPMSCGTQPIFVSLCGIQMGIQQYVDGDWISIKDGHNGDPIDPSVELAG